MSETKAKKVVQELIQRWYTGKVSEERLWDMFKNGEKVAAERRVDVLNKFFKSHVADYDIHLAQYENNIRKKKTPLNAFIIFLNSVTLVSSVATAGASKTQLAPSKLSITGQTTFDSKMSLKNEFESPALSSTRVEPNEVVVSEIKERLAQATSGQNHNLRPSTTLMRPSLNSTANSTSNRLLIKSPKPKPKHSLANWNFTFGDEVSLPVQLKIPKPIIGLPATAQERVIIAELLYTLIGINGTLIVPKLKNVHFDGKENYGIANNWIESTFSKGTIVEFDLNEQIQESIRDILTDILPLANFYFQIQNFIEISGAPESGQVLQALSAALAKLITDYYDTIAQLESLHLKGELNLHKLLFYLRPILQTMETITQICNMLQADKVRGGNVLTRLHDSIAHFSGDINSQQIIIYLTQKAAEPYMEILKLWIFKGVICDPKMEFLIEDNEKECQNPEQNEHYFDDYWEKRYVIRNDKIPRFLEKQANIVMRTGKYLNVIRECGKRVTFNQSQASLKFSHTDEHHYVNIINDAYAFSSKALLELVMDDNDLMGRLLSIKRYFLLQQGDFIIQFMDACEQELMKTIDEVIPVRLENLLELTLRLSSAKYDKYQDDLFTTLLPFDIATQMTKIIKHKNDHDDLDSAESYELRGLSCFTFGYNVQWPLSIIINQITISKYQLIFRLLFYCKHVENILCRVWTANNYAKKFDHGTAELYRTAFTLRQRMMNAIQNLEYYMMVEVIEPVWHIFMQQLAKAKNIDDVLNYHEDFLDHCLKNCMVTYPDLLTSVIALCNICIDFCKFIEDSQRHFIDAELSSMLSRNYIEDDSSGQYEQQHEPATGAIETFSQKVSRFDTLFATELISLINRIHEIAEQDSSEKFISLIHRINFNNFYGSKLNPTRQNN